MITLLMMITSKIDNDNRGGGEKYMFIRYSSPTYHQSKEVLMMQAQLLQVS